VDVGVVGKQAFLRCVVEVSAVVDARNFAGRAAEDLWFPCVKMGVEMDDGDGTVSAVDRAEQWESDGVVTA